jgi:hypothetical protein
MRRPRNVTVLVMSTSRVRISVPQNQWIADRMTKASPIDIRINCRNPAPWARIGRHITRSVTIPSSAVAAIAKKIAATRGSPQVTLTR